MPLLDHFHPPLALERRWESFHATWASEIMGFLNQEALPPRYFAETQVHFGSRVEVDVASIERPGHDPGGVNTNGGVAVRTVTPTMTLVMPALFPDEIEVQVFDTLGGATLVGAIELVSPRNKDRPEARRAFAAKCASYLHAGIGLVVVDVVTNRQANLHDELIDLLRQDSRFRFPFSSVIYSIAYRPFRTEADGDQIEIQPIALSIGGELPTMPLFLREGPTIPVDLELTYTRTCRRSQL